jgi:SAM-dependent methyltransferase
VPAGGHVLDLCCGTGVAAAALLARGFRVTGVDASAGMLVHARRRAPGARFVAADLRRFALPHGERPADGAVCLGEGLNHLLTAGDLARALARVARALRPGAALVCDVVEERRFRAHWWGQTYETREADRAFAARGTYDPATRRARMQLEVAWREDPAGCDGAAWDGVSGHGGWRSAERVLRQRCHAPAELDGALRRAGFTPAYVDAARDLGLADQAGRVFVVARRDGPRRGPRRGRRQALCARGRP